MRLVLFGVTSDLARRKVLPALSILAEAGTLVFDEVIGVTRQNPETIEIPAALSGRMRCVQLNDEYSDLGASETETWWYCVLPPSTYSHVLERIFAVSGPQDHILLEKPHGVSGDSFEDLVRLESRFAPGRVHYLDHYRAKSLAQSIATFRMANPVFRATWNAGCIEEIQLTLAEQGGLDGRTKTYEEVGALKDVLQNHALYLLGSVLMSEPEQPDRVERAIAQALSSLRVNAGDVVRGQFVGLDIADTETYAAARFVSQDPRWEGVPCSVRVGKALEHDVVELTVKYRPGSSSWSDAQYPMILRFRVQPDAGLGLEFTTGSGGDGYLPQTVRMEYCYDHSLVVDAYQAVFEAIRTNELWRVSASHESIRQGWRLIESMGRPELEYYERGSWGPESAERLTMGGWLSDLGAFCNGVQPAVSEV